jgi:hypothetical protein
MIVFRENPIDLVSCPIGLQPQMLLYAVSHSMGYYIFTVVIGVVSGKTFGEASLLLSQSFFILAAILMFMVRSSLSFHLFEELFLLSCILLFLLTLPLLVDLFLWCLRSYWPFVFSRIRPFRSFSVVLEGILSSFVAVIASQ